MVTHFVERTDEAKIQYLTDKLIESQEYKQRVKDAIKKVMEICESYNVHRGWDSDLKDILGL